MSLFFGTDMSPQARIPSPVLTFPSARSALLRLRRIADEVDLLDTTRLLVEVRVSQLNGCSVCLDMHTRELRAMGEPSRRIDTIAAWREAPYFTDAERAALALAEAATHLSNPPPQVPDDVWGEAARHFTDRQLAALVIAIATINAFNRIQVATGQITGEWVEPIIQEDKPSK